jgi:hypothetical protein
MGEPAKGPGVGGDPTPARERPQFSIARTRAHARSNRLEGTPTLDGLIELGPGLVAMGIPPYDGKQASTLPSWSFANVESTMPGGKPKDFTSA